MTEPLFWLGLSILLVAVSLAAVLMAALPALQELARAARSAEKLFDTLNRELPPTLEAIRSTGLEITNLTEDVGQNVQSAGRVVEQIDQSLTTMKQQAHQAQITTRSMMAGVKAAWQVLRRSPKSSPIRIQETSDSAAHHSTAKSLSGSSNWAITSFEPDPPLESAEGTDETKLLDRTSFPTPRDLQGEQPNQRPSDRSIADRHSQAD